MNTIMINKDGSCHEFGVDHGQADPFILGIDLRRKTALIHLKSCSGWVGRGDTKVFPAEIQAISFESLDVGERISGGEMKVFLRGVESLGSFPSTRSKALDTVCEKIEKIINEAKQ